MPMTIVGKSPISFRTCDVGFIGIYGPKMYDDISDLRHFYQTPQGRHVAAHVRPHVTRFWERATGCCNIALGFATPFIRSDHVDASLMPLRHGAHVWPRNKPVRSVLVDTRALPLPDVQVDRLLLVHALEFDPDPGRLLSECWRVIDGSGRLLIMVPHRNGIWARAEKTPFGHGRPYSRRQLRQMLQQHGFEPRTIRTALFMPPTATGWTLKLAHNIEPVGARWWPALGGVLLAEAEKMLYAPSGKTSKLRFARSAVGARLAPRPSGIVQREDQG